jgi:YidC/Oxa1 family membrane protein insertase
VGLVIVIRILIIPLFVRQVKSQRNLQLIQPQMKELQKKYAGDREKLGQEMMKLYKDTGTNPLAACFPILLQAPIFFALFRVLQYGISQEKALGYFANHPGLINTAHDAELIGVPLWGYFLGAAETPNPLTTQILTIVLVVFMSATTFLTQRQLMVKNMPADNPMAQQQKILLYVFPVIFAVGGVGFPIGVLIYWSTTNLWSMGQQFYIIRNNPTPGTPAYEAWEKRKRAKNHQKNVLEGDQTPPEVVPPKRQQPKRFSRKDRKKPN